jgi:hypothetical protein
VSRRNPRAILASWWNRGAIVRVAATLSCCLLACERTELLGVVAQDEAAGAGGTSGLVPDEPRLVDPLANASSRDTDPTFTEDRLELYFMSDRNGNKDIWRSLRATPDDPWGEPALVTELNSPVGDENPCISDDGLAIWFFTDRDRALGSIWVSRRSSRSDPWGEPVAAAELHLADGSSDVSVAVDPEETLFILNAKPTGAPPYGLYQMERTTPEEPLGTPELLTEVVSTANEYDPDLMRDGRVLVFDTAREGLPQIYFTTRAARDLPFPAAAPVPALVSAFADSAPAASEDLTYLLFSSDRTGDSEIYEVLLSSSL